MGYITWTCCSQCWTTFSQAIAQAFQCDNKCFEQHQERHLEPLLTQQKITFPMLAQPLVTQMPRDDPIFKPPIE
jgi:hypothetical protein